MARGVDEANAMIPSFEEDLAGGHGLEDTALALGPEVVVNAAAFGDEVDQRGGFVGVELVEDEDPSGLGIGVDGRCDVGGEVGFGSSDADGRKNRLAGGDLEVGDEAQGAVTTILELDALGPAGARRQAGMEPMFRTSASYCAGFSSLSLEVSQYLLLCGRKSPPLRMRSTCLGEMVSTIPRSMTSSLSSLGVQWVTGRPLSSGTSQATAISVRVAQL